MSAALPLPVEQARQRMINTVRPVPQIEQVAVGAALGRVLAADLISPIDVPAHDNSAMDGYAVRFADLQPSGDTVLTVVGSAFAGQPFGGTMRDRCAVRVMTGAVMPAECDTVVVQEIVQVRGDQLVIPAGQQAGQNRRFRGEDLAAGKTAIAAGRRLRPADLGLVASLGLAEVAVRRKVRVAFFSTGNELCSIGEPLRAGCVYDSNRPTLAGMLARLGVEPIDLGIVPDEPDALERAMRQAADCADAVISSGGVSVGEADFTRTVMAKLGDVGFWTIAMRPGRPLAFGQVGKACYFGLPGNPVAVMVTFHFLVHDALLALMGAQLSGPVPLRARSAAAFRKKPGRTEYQRAVLARGPDGAWEVRPTGQQGSGVLSSMSRADCMVVLHHEQGSVAAGDMVDVVLFEGLI